MELTRKQIADGISLSYLETDKFKTGFMSVNFIAPLDPSTASKNALIPSILTRGSVKYPTLADINKRLDYLYASGISTRNEKRGEMQVFGITAGMIDSAYTMGGENLVFEVTDMLFDILLCPKTSDGVFDSAYTESEKKNLIDSINAKINNKAQYASQRCIFEMCCDEPFGLLETGTVEDVSACTAKSIYDQYKYALKCYPIEIFFVGKCDIEAFAVKLSEIFASVPRSPIKLKPSKIIRKAEKIKHISEDMPVNQGKLSIGLRTGCVLGEDDYYAMMMFNAVFGGGVTSKLFMNVREKKSLCYTVSSALVTSKGLMRIYAGVDKDKCSFAIAETDHQIKQIERGNITDEELRDAKITLISSLRGLEDSPGSMAGWFLQHILAGRADRTPDSVAAIIDSLTKEDVVRISRKVSFDTLYILEGTAKADEDVGDEEDSEE